MKRKLSWSIQRSCERAVDVWNKEQTDTIWVFIVDDRTPEILVHVIKESVLLKRNYFCVFCSTVL
jgi:hypothetical protein